MITKQKVYISTALIFIIGTAVIVFRILFDFITNTDLLGFLGILITLYFGLIKYFIESDRVLKELFTEFNRRYDRLNAKLNELNMNKENKKTILENVRYQKIVYDYFNLCAEEFLWYKKGRIPEKIWESWENGMLYYFRNQVFQKYLEKELEQDFSYYGFISYIQKRLNRR